MWSANCLRVKRLGVDHRRVFVRLWQPFLIKMKTMAHFGRTNTVKLINAFLCGGFPPGKQKSPGHAGELKGLVGCSY